MLYTQDGRLQTCKVLQAEERPQFKDVSLMDVQKNRHGERASGNVNKQWVG